MLFDASKKKRWWFFFSVDKKEQKLTSKSSINFCKCVNIQSNGFQLASVWRISSIFHWNSEFNSNVSISRIGIISAPNFIYVCIVPCIVYIYLRMRWCRVLGWELRKTKVCVLKRANKWHGPRKWFVLPKEKNLRECQRCYKLCMDFERAQRLR